MSTFVNIESDKALEDSVLGSMMRFYPNAYQDAKELLVPQCFSDEQNRKVFKLIVDIAESGENVDIMSVFQASVKKGYKDITAYALSRKCDMAGISYYDGVKILYELYVRSKVYMLCSNLANAARDRTTDIADTIAKCSENLDNIFSLPSSGIVSMQDAGKDLYENHIKRNLESEKNLSGSPTGFTEFDRKSGGMQDGWLMIVAGETSMGKSSLSMNIVVNAARNGSPVAYYSLEMTNAELFSRILASESHLTASTLLYSRLSEAQMNEYSQVNKVVENLPIYFDDSSSSNIDVIINSIRSMVAKRGVKGVVIDYLQILSVNSKNTNAEELMATAARRLKNLAKELGIWIIGVSQLRRDNLNPVPTMNRLRSSGQIEEAADVVVLIYRPEYYKKTYPSPFSKASTIGTAMIDVAKGRSIGTFKFIVGFDKDRTCFYNMNSVPQNTDNDNPF